MLRHVASRLGRVARCLSFVLLATCRGAEFTSPPPANRAPTAAIIAPAPGATFRAGEVVNYAGGATDPEDGELPGARMTWRVELHAAGQVRTVLPATAGAAGGSITIPTQAEATHEIFYRFHLEARDSEGAVAVATRDMLPLTSSVRLATVPAGLQLTLDGQSRTAPADVASVVGTSRTLGAPSPQVMGGVQYVFSSWSDGGAASHGITTLPIATTYTATFSAVPPPNQAPSITVSAPVVGASITLGSTVSVAAIAADADGGVTRVEFFANGTPIGSDAAAPFLVPWTPAAVGAVALTARATDDDGATTTAAAVNVTVVAPANQPPTVALSQPTAGSTVVVNTPLAIRATAADADGTVTQVAFFADGVAIGSDGSAPFEVAWTPATLGGVVLTARATDDDGATTTSAPVGITVGPPANLAPSIVLGALAGGTTITLGSTVTVTASASDPDGAVTAVDFFADATPIGSDATPPFAVSWTPTTTGTRTLTARATDDDGATTTSVGLQVTVVTPPNQPPVVALTAPAPGTTIALGNTVTVSATATDGDGTVAQVEFLAGATSLGTDATAPFAVTWTPAALGGVTLTARATDDDGAVSTSSAVTVTITEAPNQPPSVAMTAPAGGTTITLGATLSLAATAADADGTISQVAFFAGATLLGTDASAPFTLDWTPPAAGPWSLTARATDDDGAITTSTPVAVTVLPPPNVAPSVTLTEPAAGSSFLVGTPVTLRSTATDSDGSIVLVEFLANGVPVGSDASAPFEVTWTPAASGGVTLTARATDDDGAVTTSAAVAVTITPPVNQQPSVVVTAPASGATITLGATVTIAATATDADGSIVQVAFFDGATLLGTDASAPYAIDWTPATPDAHVLTARATDDDGAITTSAPVTVTVQPPPNVAPAVTITQPAAGSTSVANTPLLVRATATDADGTVVQVEFLANGAPIGTDATAPFEATWTPASAGPVTLAARATDDDGAVTTSATVGITILPPPNAPPVASIATPAQGTTFRAGDVVDYAGSGSDAEDGAIPPSRMTWWVNLHHDTHTHPLVPATTGAASGSVAIPDRVETSDNIWYRIHLAVTDAAGVADTTFRDILPLKATMRFETVPAGLQLTLDGQPISTPRDVVGVVGTLRTLGAPDGQVLAGQEYRFASWSDGLGQEHDIATPGSNTTYIATFTAVAPANQPPTVTVTAPANGATLTIDQPVTVTATATDPDGTVTQVQFFDGATPIGTDASAPYSITWTPTTLDAHVITARATDDDGAVTTSSGISVIVEAAGSGDVTAPVVQLTAPANDATGLTGAILASATATDDVGVVGVTFQVDGETIGAEDTTAPYEVTLPATSAYTTGQHVFRARARDAAGNVSAWATATVGFGGNVSLPQGFASSPFVTGLGPSTTMAFAPDGRLFVAQQAGAMRIVKNGVLLSTPFHTFQTAAAGETGLLGVTFDPDFATNQHVYVYYTAQFPSRNIVVRITANGDVAEPSSQVTLLELPTIGPLFHNGGALHFGPDGKLYVATGDNGSSSNAPSLSSPLGKILRINRDGTIPSDNPFFGQTTGINQAIWARGLRNPFTFGFRPGTGRMLINDVGQDAWEEVNEGVAGSNYGWPTTEGYTTNPAFRSPIFAYPHSGAIVSGLSVVGAAFYDPATATFPSSYAGDYFFGDYVSGWVNRLDLDNGNAVYAFARFAGNLVDVRVGPDGGLYVLSSNVSGTWGVWRVQRTP